MYNYLLVKCDICHAVPPFDSVDKILVVAAFITKLIDHISTFLVTVDSEFLWVLKSLKVLGICCVMILEN